jgi:membrane-associated phospholipid phosphatase
MSGKAQAYAGNFSPKPKPGFLTTLARIITNVTAPPFLAIPTYLILDFYDEQKRGVAANFVLSLILSVSLGVVLPVVFIVLLRYRHQISDVHIPIREQRTVPFLVTIFCYALATVLLLWASGTGALTATMFCYTLTTIAVLIINFYWKISVHATGIGGPLAALTFVIGWWTLPFFLLFPIVGWARVHLKAHTLGQVLAGSLLGYSFNLLQLTFIFHPLGWI